MNKNGFIFVETIVAIVVLTSSLLLLYNTFTRILQNEKSRVYYDDVNYIYRSIYLRNKLSKLNLNGVINNLETNENVYFTTIGLETPNLVNEDEKNFMSNLLLDFDVSQMLVVKANKLDNLKTCNIECSLDSNCSQYENCNSLYTNVSDNMINYLKTIYVDVDCKNILVSEYKTCTTGNHCQNYYSWVCV